MNPFKSAINAIFADDPHIEIPPVPTAAHPRPSIRDIIAGVKLPNTAEQSAMIKSLGLKTVEPVLKIGNVKIESPFRPVAPPVDEAPAEVPESRPLHQPSTLNHQPSPSPADPLVPFSTIKAHCAQQDAELATLRAQLHELENKLRWSHQREAALREELHAERNPPVHNSPSSPPA